jgi:iron complex outermembrane receptor protein
MQGIGGVLLMALVAVVPLHPRLAAAEEGGVLAGVATAPDGARLPGVSLTFLHGGSGVPVRAVTSEAGVFRVLLPSGRYALDAELDGFQPYHADVVLGAGETVTVAVRLAVATVSEEVRVLGVAPRHSVEAFELRESRARDVGEALAVLPGVVPLRKGPIANDVVVRGLQGKDLTILIDGQRIDGACPGHMDPPAFHVDFAEVSRVEMSKGPFDVKNQGGLGGTVNVVTERPQRGWHGSASVTVATAATFAPSASGSVGGAAWALLGGASARRAAPYTDGAGVRVTERTNYRRDAVADLAAYDAWTAWGRLALAPRAGSTVQLSYSRQSADEIVYPYLQMDAMFDNADRAGARLEVAELPGAWGALAAHAYYTRVDHWMTDELRTSATGMARPWSMATRARTTIAGARGEVQRGGLTIGVEASRRRWSTTTMLAMQEYEPQAPLADAAIDVAGAFGAYSASVGRAWRIDAGGRLDRGTTTADPLPANTALYLAYHGATDTRASDPLPAASIRATWRVGDGLTSSFGAGYTTRLPDQQERYYALRRGGTDWVGNPALSPSRNTGADAEVRYTRHGTDATVAGFVYRVDDHILVQDRSRQRMVPGVMNASARSYANVDALVRGVETSVTLPLAPAVFLSADGSLVRGTTRQATALGRDLPEMPAARARLRIRYDNARWNAAAEVLAVAAQQNVATALQEVATPGFAVLNLRVGLRWRPVVLTAGVENVFDAFYAEHLSFQRDPFRSGVRVHEPGRTVSLNVAARF